MADIEASIKAASEAGKVGVVGYCWGGALAWAASTRLPGVAASVCYYGGGIAAMLDEVPKAPTITHFGELDKHIPQTDVAKIRAAFPHLSGVRLRCRPRLQLRERGSFNPKAADLAKARTLEFLADKLT